MKDVLDYFGNELEVGDEVAYTNKNLWFGFNTGKIDRFKSTHLGYLAVIKYKVNGIYSDRETDRTFKSIIKKGAISGQTNAKRKKEA